MSVSPLISAAQAVLTISIPLATEQIKGAVLSFQDDLTSLHRRLTMIEALLTDAENSPRKIKSEVLKLWLKNLKLAICDAENVLDKIAYESLRGKLELRKRDKVSNFFSPSNPLVFRPKIANKVKNINSLLDRICEEADEIGLSPANQLISVVVEPSKFTRLTHPFIDDSAVVGRNGDVSTVRDMLLGSAAEDDLSVVAIVGMAGLGKTTLAQLLYKDKDVVSYFCQKMWICVSDDFDVPRLLNEMMQSPTGHKSDTPNIEGIVTELRKKLDGKKYLLVLEDVWNTSTNKWECMRNCLQGIGSCKGSKIIVTTRSMEVVSTMRMSPSHTHRLSELSYDDSWNMFRKRAFGNGGPRENQTLVDIGRRMVAQCKCVPLAINSLGGLLYSKQHESEWELIEKTEIWKSLVNEDGILPILRLSYDHLASPCLKQCFAYCAVFPKDININKNEWIQLWMGLGYLHPFTGSDFKMEDLGNEYFNILLRNSFFQEVELNEYNDITSCKMHDLVHDLALHVAESSYLTLEANEVKNHPNVQHLSLNLGEETGHYHALLWVRIWGHRIEELGSLNQLRGRLRVHNLMLVKGREEAEKSNMIVKKGMQELVFHFGLERRGLSHIQCSNHADVLEGLQPHKNLKGLRLEMFEGYWFASWMTSVDSQFLQNLVKIELRYCVVCEQVPTLIHLPHLEVVEMAHLDNLKRIGPEFYGLDEGIVGCSSSNSGVTA